MILPFYFFRLVSLSFLVGEAHFFTICLNWATFPALRGLIGDPQPLEVVEKACIWEANQANWSPCLVKLLSTISKNLRKPLKNKQSLCHLSVKWDSWSVWQLAIMNVLPKPNTELWGFLPWQCLTAVKYAKLTFACNYHGAILRSSLSEENLNDYNFF